MEDETYQKRLDWLTRASGHWNEHIREEAVDELAQLGGQDALALLLARVNDRVPDVRAAAAGGLIQFVKVENAALWVEYLPALQRLRDCRRSICARLLQRVESLLARPECAQVLAQGLLSSDSRIRRYCFLIRCSTFNVWDESLVDYAFYTSDVVVHRRFVQYLPQSRTLLLSQLRWLLGHAYAPLRRLALERLVAQYPDQSAGELAAGLFDRSSIVRRAAERLHTSLGQDPAASYRWLLEQPKSKGRAARYALLGLSELGDLGDWDLLVCYFRSPESALRRCALAGLFRLDAERARESLLEGLVDQSPSVVRDAKLCLDSHRTRPSLEELEMVVELASDTCSVWAVLWLARWLTKWDALILLLLLLDSHGKSDTRLAEKVQILLAAWARYSNRCQTEAPEAQRERILPLWNCNRAALDPSLALAIEWHFSEST